MKFGIYSLLQLTLFSTCSFALDSGNSNNNSNRRIYLSYKVKEIHDHIIKTNTNYPNNAIVPPELLVNTGDLILDTITTNNSSSHCKYFQYAMMKAQEEILVATHRFDKNSHCGKYAGEIIRSLNEKNRTTPLRVIFVMDSMAEYFHLTELKEPLQPIETMHTRLRSVDPGLFGLPTGELKNVELSVKSFHKGIHGAMHSNMIIIDGKRVLMGTSNWENVRTQEYSAIISGTIAESFRQDFQRIINTHLPPLRTIPEILGRTSMLYVGRRASSNFPNKDTMNAQDQALLKALEVSRSYVFIQAPKINTESFANKIIETVKRGVRVIIITNMDETTTTNTTTTTTTATTSNNETTNILANNKDTFSYLYKQLDQADWIRLHACYYVANYRPNMDIPAKPMTKLKTNISYMDVDGEFAFIGSANFDPLSFYYSSESNVIIDDEKETKRLTRKFGRNQSSLENCYFNEEGVDGYDVTEFWTLPS